MIIFELPGMINWKDIGIVMDVVGDILDWRHYPLKNLIPVEMNMLNGKDRKGFMLNLHRVPELTVMNSWIPIYAIW